jgi:hypothetical protein
MRILVTGSRTWNRAATIYRTLDTVAREAAAAGATELVIVHGACPHGADATADTWTRNNTAPLPVRAEAHPADWGRHGRGAGFHRNHQMVLAGADLCLAFIRDGSPGALHCAGVARRAGIETRHIPWDDPAGGQP